MSSLKEQVIEMVASIDDEHLLELVKADIEFFKDKNTDIIDELNKEDKEDLMNLSNEPAEKDTITEGEYKAATARWRTK